MPPTGEARQLYQQARQASDQGRWQEALELLRNSCRLDRELGWNWLELGELWRQRGS